MVNIDDVKMVARRKGVTITEYLTSLYIYTIYKSMYDKKSKKEIEKLKGLMAVASSSLDFETAIKMRDRIAELKKLQTKLNKKY